MTTGFTLPPGLFAVVSALVLAVGLNLPGKANATTTSPADVKTICGGDREFPVRKLGDDSMVDFCQETQGKVVLVVNTASRCAFTDQYEGLETLYGKYRDQGLVVVGFPSNDFGNQEPGSEEQIKSFCRLTYGVRFPMFGKTQVTGRGAAPLYQALTEALGQAPRWNFHKYLIDRNGQAHASFGSSTAPLSRNVVGAIEALL